MTTFLTPDPIVLEVRNAAGYVTIDLTDTTTTAVELTQLQGTGVGIIDDLLAGFRRGPDPAGDQTAIDAVRVDLQVQEGGTVLIVDTDPARSGWRSSFGVHITAPIGSGVRAQTQSADVRITGRADRLDVRSASGDVQADIVDRGSLIHTASGNVGITEIGADAEIRSASGDIAVERSSGSLSMQSTSGDVRVLRPRQSVFARSVSGSISVLDAVTGTVEATAVSGNVEVAVHTGSLARIDLNTLSGTTRNEFEVTDEPRTSYRATESTQFDATVDDLANRAAETDVIVDLDKGNGPSAAAEPGRLLITCRTTSGDIRLRRAAGTLIG